MRARTAVVVVPLLLLLAVSCPTPPELPQTPLRLDVVLQPGEVRCGPITRQSELIGGPGAYAQVGRAFRCMNDRVRFAVQDSSRPVGVSSVGGDLIDVDRVRADEASDGLDLFREHASAFGAHEIDVEAIEVVNDGRDGKPAVVRVRGTAGPVTMAPGAIALSQPMPARLQTDYILAPDADYIEIKTTIFNESDDQLPNVLYADFLALGSQRPFTPQFGYGEPPFFQTATFVGQARGEDVSYGFACSDADPTLMISQQAVSLVLCRDDQFVAREASYSRYLVVGDGTVQSLVGPVYALRGIEHGTIEGRVLDDTGAPVDRVLVAALSGAVDAESAHVVNEARTDADGRYRLTMQPGAYVVVAHATVRGRSAAQSVAVTVDERVAAADLVIGRPGALEVATTFLDRDGRPMRAQPAKLTLVPLDAGLNGTVALRDAPPSYQVTTGGRFHRELPPGRWRVYVTRGFEWTRDQLDVEVVAGEATRVTATIRHVVDTTGLIGAEFHQHSLGSVDATVPYDVKVMENAAEGVEYAASTDHDNVVDFPSVVDRLGLGEFLQCVAGNEVSYTGIGHFNVYPWDVDEADPFRDLGSRMWWLKTVPEVFADARAAAGDPIVQINHLRKSNSGYLASLGFDPSDGSRIAKAPPGIPTFPPTIYSAWSGAFDAVEVNGDLGDPALFTDEGQAELHRRAVEDASNIPGLADYLALLGAGLPVAAMGNSDTHTPNEGVGYPRNFLRLGKDRPSSVVKDDVRTAIRGQDVMVAQGCLIELFVDDARPMGVDEAVDRTALAGLRARVQAPPHVEVERLELYVNGRVQQLVVDAAGAIAIDGAGGLSVPVDVATGARARGVVRLEAPISGLPAGDLAVVAVARGGGGLSPTGGGSTLCYSAPLYVDDGGEGWRGWLEATQTVR